MHVSRQNHVTDEVLRRKRHLGDDRFQAEGWQVRWSQSQAVYTQN